VERVRSDFGAATVGAAASASQPELAPEDTLVRIHPNRLFYPGQTYQPEELTGDTDPGTFVHRPSGKTRQLYKRGHAANAALYEQAVFTNGRLLQGFMTDTAKLVPRRTSKVDAKVQRALVRAIKTARQMAILPFVRDGLPLPRGPREERGGGGGAPRPAARPAR